MIEAIKGPGASRAKAICDGCGREEVVACGYAKKRGVHSGSEPIRSQIVHKLAQSGWGDVKGALRCPACEAKRKVVPMTKAKPSPSEEPPREPTKAQKRAIVDLLSEVYDTDAERYTGGETDHTVALTLGVLPGWVANIRDEMFGPDGGNDQMAKLAARIDAAEKSMLQMEAEATEIMGRADDLAKRVKGATDSLGQMRASLRAVQEAVGPAKRAKAGVR